MRFVTNESLRENPPVHLILTLEKYCGCELPTLKANGVSVLHLLYNGTIVVREGKDTDIGALDKMGFVTEDNHPIVRYSGELS